MAVGLEVGNLYWEIGDPDFVHAFFSTISYHLEPDGWGSRFPVVLGELYQGELAPAAAGAARAELWRAQEELAQYPPSEVVWDIEDAGSAPPWGNNISPDITNLANYFVTSDGRDLFEVLDEALRALQRANEPLRIA